MEMSSVFNWRAEPSTMWREFAGTAKVKAASTAAVQRRREQGCDVSTIHGLSRKADAVRAPHGGAYTRAEHARRPMDETGKAGCLRSLLRAYGPLTHAQLSECSGFPYKSIGGLLANDVDHGRVRILKAEGEVRRFEWVGEGAR
jgi:hypothetical protein